MAGGNDVSSQRSAWCWPAWHAPVDLARIVTEVPDFLPARMFLGEALAKSGRLDEALYAEVSVLLARQKRFDEAVSYAARAVEFRPTDADLRYNLDVLLVQQGKFAGAVGPLTEALRLNPGHPKAAVQLSRAKDVLAHQP